MTSQFLAIYYLNDLDHFIKEKLSCKYYIRYMDDFVILDTDHEKLKKLWKIIEKGKNLHDLLDKLIKKDVKYIDKIFNILENELELLD